MQTNKKTYISKSGQNTEQNIWWTMQQSQLSYWGRFMYIISWQKEAPLCRNCASGVLLSGMLQVTNGMNCPCIKAADNTALHLTTFDRKTLSNMETRYSNNNSNVLPILHRLQKFPHYCFTHEISTITDQKPFVAIFKKDAVTLSWWLQHILLAHTPGQFCIL